MAEKSGKAAASEAAERMQAAGSTMMDTGSALGKKMLDQAEANTHEAFKAMRAATEARRRCQRLQDDERDQQGNAQARREGHLRDANGGGYLYPPEAKTTI